MTTAELRPMIREMLAIHEALRKLRFRPEDIYVLDVAVPGEPGDTIGICLQAQGRICNIPVGRLAPTEPFEAFADEWNLATEHVNDGTFADADLRAMYEASEVFRYQGKFLAYLHLSGIRIAH